MSPEKSVPAAGDPLDDPARLAAVRRIIVPGSRSEALDRLTALAANLLRASSAQVSVIAEHQLVLGLSGPDLTEEEWGGPREDSLCTVTVRSDGPLAVSDALTDPRVSALLPVVGGLVGSYLGVPLVTSDGHVSERCASTTTSRAPGPRSRSGSSASWRPAWWPSSSCAPWPWR